MAGVERRAPGTAMKYDRFTMAKTGKEPTLKLLQTGRMPNTGKREPKRMVK